MTRAEVEHLQAHKRALETQVAGLQASVRQQRALFDSIVDFAIITTDLEGRITDWNTGAQRILGWSADEICGQMAARFFTSEDRAAGQIETEMRKAVQHGYAIDERWHMRKDGTRFWASGEMMPLQTADDEHCGFIKVLRDRTQQHLEGRQIETDLENSKNFTRLALTSVGGVGIWFYDVGPDSFTCDDAVSALYGLDAEKAKIGVSAEYILARIHPDDLPSVRAAISGHLEPGSDLELEYRICHPDGAIRWVLSRSHIFCDDAGNVVRRAGVSIEMTKQRALEDQFRQSQKMEAVGQLTGGLAHDFNNLLTGITGSLELLGVRLSQGRLKDTERYLTAAQDAAKRAAALTHRLLAFARRQTLDPKPTDVSRLAVGMEDLIRRTVGPHIKVETVIAEGLWPTLVDPNQLENALLNLCLNARDAMPGGGKLTIEARNRRLDEYGARERDVPSGHYVSLCVSDSGVGMSKDVIAKAFDPFFTTKPLGEGTGLGLSMIYGFVRQSGGQVRIYSEVGQGTTVCLYLPRHHRQEEPVEQPAELADAPRAERGETVLVVDDEPTVRMLVTEVLEELGYIALEAADGAAGLEILRSNVRIDLLVSDVGLPGGMNGRQMADAALLERPDLQVLFITGFAENAIISHGHLAPGMHVMMKPFTLEVLASRMKELINGNVGDVAGKSSDAADVECKNL
jgi:PAS domain S-box-containing protein